MSLNIRIINVFSWVSIVCILSSHYEPQPTSASLEALQCLGRSDLALLLGRTAQTPSLSLLLCACLHVSQLPELGHFLLSLIVLLCIPQTQCLSSGLCTFNIQLVQIVERLSIHFLESLHPWNSIVVLSHPYACGSSMGFVPEAALEDLSLSNEYQAWR